MPGEIGLKLADLKGPVPSRGSRPGDVPPAQVQAPGIVPVGNLQPALQPGHRLRVYFDGTAQEVSGMQFQLQEVYRGAHNLQAEVLDENGQLMIRSEPTRFYVQQTTIVNPRGG